MYEVVDPLLLPTTSQCGKFCRLCFNQADDLRALFPSSASIPNKALLHKIFDCTTITLSYREDHDARICSNCIVSIEAFFKYKVQCVENDRLLRTKRASFFAGLGLAADLAGVGRVSALEHGGQHKRRHHQIQQHSVEVFGVGDDDDSDDDDERRRREDSKRQRTTNGTVQGHHEVEANGEEGELETREAENDDGDDGGRLASYRIKQEVVPLARTEDDDDDGLMLVEDGDMGRLVGRTEKREHAEEDGGGGDGDDDDDDDEEYFNPDQFLAQETQIDEGTDATIGDEDDAGDGVSSDGDSGLVPNGHAGAEELLNSITAAAAMASSFERGWKTTEFAPQPGSSGMRTLKITDYSNVTGKRGRPQRFETDALLTAAAAAAAGNNLLAFHEELQRLNGLVGGRVPAGAGQLFPPDGRVPPHHPAAAAVGASPVSRRLGPNGSVIEHTKKVQKFLDDGLRELIYNAGAPNPHYARDGGSTAFKVVKARFNSYNIIFDDNRFLRRNKSVSGLPKWYWACSVTGCPVKICSYAGRLFKTNELPHTHPATEPDADSKYETIAPDPHEAEQLQRQLLLQQQQQHQAQQERMLRQQQQQQLLRQRQIEMAQRRVAAAAAMMAAAAVSARSTTETAPAEHPKASAGGSRSNYELQTAADGTEMLLYGGHSLALIMTRKDGVRVYRCTSIVADEGAIRRPCTDTIFLLTSGRIGRICKEEDVDYEMDLTPLAAAGEDQQRGEHGAEEDDKRRRMQKIIVYEGYRYKYCHARPEGNFYWRCVQRHEKDCLASLQTKRNLEFLKVNDQPHNHEAPDPSEPHENAMLCEIRLPVAGDQSEHGSTDFKLVKSGQKREFLIYKGYRYYFQYESKNGRRSYRCTMFKNCPAGAFLLPNSTIQEAKNFIHTHPPVEDMDKYITKDSLITSPIKVTSGGDGRSSTAADASPSKASEPPPGVPDPVAKDPEVARRNGYRIIKNYKNKEIMIYLGWRYFEDYKKKTGGQVWRCSSHRLCRGSVHLFPDGSINFAKLVDHNHSPPKKNHQSGTTTVVDGAGDGGLALLEDGTGASSLHGGDDSLLRSWGGVYHRYITHQGHRFRFATRKREGTIYWRCAMRLVTKCPVSFHTKDDTYELVSTRNHEHNHAIPSEWPDVAGGQIEADLPQVRLPAEEVGTSDFVLTKNAKGRDLVLYRGGRFYLDYSRKDGKIVFRCSAVSGCRATVLLLPNRTLQVPEEFNHNHPTAQDAIGGWCGAGGGEPTVSGAKTDDESGMDDGAGAGQTGEPMPAKIILHDGYHFRFVSRHPTEQSAFYRCVWVDARKAQCPVALYTDLRGVVIQTSQQPHSHDPSDYGMVGGQPPPSTTTATMANGITNGELIGTREYRIVKNWKNRDVLVFQNCRYFLHYVRKDGRKVWRCSAIRSCHAAVYLNADGTVDQFRGHHVHEIRPEGEPRRRRRRKKAELMVSFAGAANGGTIYAGNGPVMLGAAELVARSRLFEGAVNGAVSMLNGNHVPGAVGNAALMASIAGSLNGGNHSNANSHNGAVGNEWIDYSDYGIRLNVAPNDGGTTSAARLPNEDNGSLWDHFHPHQALGEGTSDGRRGGEAPSGFDLSYHSVFGNQENFAESVTYAAHAIAQHQLHQQHQRHLQQQLQHHQSMLLNGHHSQQPPAPPPQHEISSDDHDEYDQGSGEEQQQLQHDDHPPLMHLEPEVKLESDDL